MTTAFYVIWCLVPTFFFGLALWAKLENVSGQTRKDNPGDLFRQGGFVALCVGVAILLDQYLLPDLYSKFSPDWIPYGFYQLVLLPFILYLASMIIGPSTDIRISKAPKPSQRKTKK